MITDRSGLHSVLYWTKKTYPNIFQVYCKPTANVLFRFAQIRRHKKYQICPNFVIYGKAGKCYFCFKFNLFAKRSSTVYVLLSTYRCGKDDIKTFILHALCAECIRFAQVFKLSKSIYSSIINFSLQKDDHLIFKVFVHSTAATYPF